MPAIFNTDQGSQFTSDRFTSVLKSHQIKISAENIFILPALLQPKMHIPAKVTTHVTGNVDSPPNI